MSPQTDIRTAIESVEDHLFTGLLKQARCELLALLDRRKLDREIYWELASLARLADMPDRGVKLLFRVVRPPLGRRSDASELEQAIYAQCLNEIGSTGEAFQLLEGLNAKKLPRVLLYRSLCLINRNDWGGTIPLLSSLSTHPAALSYEKVTARVWLAGALVHGFGNMHRARKLLAEALREATPDFGRVLHKHAKRFLIESLVADENWHKVEQELENLAKISQEDDDPYFSIFVRHQHSIVEYAKHGKPRKLDVSLRNVSRDYQRLHYWEDARACELGRATRLGDTESLRRLYVGTPFPHFRTKIRALLTDDELPTTTFNWPLGVSMSSTHFVDIADGSSSFSAFKLARGTMLQRLLEILTIDLYRPQRVTELHERLHPGEYFNPASSPDRVHQLLKRLRAWIRQARLPLEIFEYEGMYELRATISLSLRLAVDREAQAAQQRSTVKAHGALATLRAAFNTREFTAGDVAEKLTCSRPTAVRMLTAATSQEVVQRIGAGRATRYRFT